MEHLQTVEKELYLSISRLPWMHICDYSTFIPRPTSNSEACWTRRWFINFRWLCLSFMDSNHVPVYYIQCSTCDLLARSFISIHHARLSRITTEQQQKTVPPRARGWKKRPKFFDFNSFSNSLQKIIAFNCGHFYFERTGKMRQNVLFVSIHFLLQAANASFAVFVHQLIWIFRREWFFVCALEGGGVGRWAGDKQQDWGKRN